jgi:predicted nuclease of predicted toxin-antitoxin system
MRDTKRARLPLSHTVEHVFGRATEGLRRSAASGCLFSGPVAELRAAPLRTSHRLRSSSHGDEDVLAIARQEKRILLVADRDLGELIFHQGLEHEGVLFFRLPGANLQTRIDRLNTVLTDHVDELPPASSWW